MEAIEREGKQKNPCDFQYFDAKSDNKSIPKIEWQQ